MSLGISFLGGGGISVFVKSAESKEIKMKLTAEITILTLAFLPADSAVCYSGSALSPGGWP